MILKEAGINNSEIEREEKVPQFGVNIEPKKVKKIDSNKYIDSDDDERSERSERSDSFE